MIKGVFFDLYGTLLVYADMPAAWTAWISEFHDALRGHGLTWPREELMKRTGSFFTEDPPSPTSDRLTVYERKIRHLGFQAEIDLSPGAVREIATRTIEVWQRHIPLDPEAIPVLQQLKARGTILALITNFDHPPHVHALLARLGIASFFDSVILSGTVGMKKPDPRIFRLALDPAALEPSRVWGHLLFEFGESKVQQLCASLGQHDVAWLQVPVRHALTVRLVQRVSYLDGVSQYLIQRQRAFVQSLGQCFPFQVLHDQEVDSILLADVVQDTDVGMVETGDRSGFALKSFSQLRLVSKMRGQDLDGNSAVQASITGLVDFSHSARA